MLNSTNQTQRRRNAILLISGIVLISSVLRAPVTAVGPLLQTIQADLGLSTGMAGLLASLPVFIFAAVSPFAGLSRKMGVERCLLLALLLIAAGVLARSLGFVQSLFAGTVVLSIGIALGNVLLPALIKRDFPQRATLFTTLYATWMSSVGAVGSGLAVPVAAALTILFSPGGQAVPAVGYLPNLSAGPSVGSGPGGITGPNVGSVPNVGPGVVVDIDAGANPDSGAGIEFDFGSGPDAGSGLNAAASTNVGSLPGAAGQSDLSTVGAAAAHTGRVSAKAAGLNGAQAGGTGAAGTGINGAANPAAPDTPSGAGRPDSPNNPDSPAAATAATAPAGSDSASGSAVPPDLEASPDSDDPGDKAALPAGEADSEAPPQSGGSAGDPSQASDLPGAENPSATELNAIDLSAVKLSSLSWRGSLALWAVVALTAAAVWLPQTRRRGDSSTRSRPGLGVAASVLKSPISWQATLFMGAQAMSFYSLAAWLAAILAAHGYSARAAGWLLAFYQLVGLVSGLILPFLITRVRDQRLIAAACALMCALGALGLFFGPQQALIWLALAGLGSGASFIVAIAFISLRTDDHRQAAILSIMINGGGYAIAALGPIFFGWLHQRTQSWSLVLLLIAGIGLAQTWLGWLAGRDKTIPPA